MTLDRNKKQFPLSITAFRSIGREFHTLCWNLLYVSWTLRGIVESLRSIKQLSNLGKWKFSRSVKSLPSRFSSSEQSLSSYRELLFSTLSLFKLLNRYRVRSGYFPMLRKKQPPNHQSLSTAVKIWHMKMVFNCRHDSPTFNPIDKKHHRKSLQTCLFICICLFYLLP